MSALPYRLSSLSLAFVAVFMLSGFVSLEKAFAPESDLWDRWQAHDATSTESLDHSRWDRILKAYIATDPTGLNRFDYGGVSEADRQALDSYVADMGGVAISTLNRDEQFAYWLNLYNAITVQVILDHYPVDSITDISLGGGGLFSSGPWSADIFKVEGEEVSLNDIEHRILRPIWNDPRIHYGVNCASIGCPNLQVDAFTSANLEATLDQAAKDYINNLRGVSLTDGKLTASKIYLWFQVDFGDSEAGVLAHIRQYASPDLLAKLDGINDIDGFEYDWSLNGAVEDQAASGS